MRRTELRRVGHLDAGEVVVEVVWERDAGSCARCGNGITGERGTDWSVHHRRPRRAGGDRRPDVNLPSNLVILHPDCHQRVEEHRSLAYDLGFLLRYTDVPSQRPIHHSIHGWAYLTDDGAVAADPPEATP